MDADLLRGLRILEFAEGIAGPVCGLQLADLGATVIKIEPPDGDRTRGWGKATANGGSAIFDHLNRGKRSVIIDWSNDADRALFDKLLADADGAIVHLDPAEHAACGIDWRSAARDLPRLMLCELSDHGQAGALAGRAGSELTAQALSGFSRYAGTPDTPCRLGYETASIGAGMHAVQAMLAMAIARDGNGRGDYCHISVLGQTLSLKTILLAAQSDPDTWSGFHLKGPHLPADTGWPAADGQVTFDFRHNNREGWAELCRTVGLAHLLDDPEYADWRSTIYIGNRTPTHGEPYRRAFRSMKAADLSELINRLGGISMHFQDYAALFAHPQLAHLAPFVAVHGTGGSEERQIGSPFRFADGGPTTDQVDPAPQLGATPRAWS